MLKNWARPGLAMPEYVLDKRDMATSLRGYQATSEQRLKLIELPK